MIRERMMEKYCNNDDNDTLTTNSITVNTINNDIDVIIIISQSDNSNNIDGISDGNNDNDNDDNNLFKTNTTLTVRNGECAARNRKPIFKNAYEKKPK